MNSKILKQLREFDVQINEEFNEHITISFLGLSNMITGGKGIPVGSIMELYGEEGIGKSSLVLQLSKDFIYEGYVVYYIDVERAINLIYLKSYDLEMGRDFHLIIPPIFAEDVFELINLILENEKKCLIVLDTVAALAPKMEMEKGLVEKSTLALQAQVISSAMRKLINKKDRQNIIFINQEREKPGFVFGERTYTPGGKAIKYYCDLRIKMKRKKLLDNGKIVRIKTVKNKFYYPYLELLSNFIYGSGFDIYDNVIDILVDIRKIKKKNDYFLFNNKQFKKNELIDYLKNNERIFRSLIKKYTEKRRQENE